MKRRKLVSLLLVSLLLSACTSSSYINQRHAGEPMISKVKGAIKLCRYAVPQAAGEVVLKSEAVENDYFNDAAFVGDSRIVGLSELNVLVDTTARIYGSVSLDVSKALMRSVFTLDQGSMGTMMEALAQTQVQKVYLSFGLNELGWQVLDVFKENYINIIQQVKAIQPQAQIYLLDVYNFSKSRENEHEYTTLNQIKAMNEAIKEVAKETQVNLIHSNAMFETEDTYLPNEWTSDGYHLNSEGFEHWLEMVKEHVNKGGVVYETKPCLD